MKIATQRATNSGSQAWQGRERRVAALRDPATYPEPTTLIEALETHYSWVFLTVKVLTNPNNQHDNDF